MSRRVHILLFTLVAGLITSHSLHGQTSPAAVDSLYVAATTHHDAGNYDAAVDLYNQVLSLDASHANAHWFLANIKYQHGQFEDALAGYRRVTELAPEFSSGYGNLSWTLILLGLFEEARLPAQRAMELDPETYVWPLNAGHVRLLSGHPDSATVFYEVALLRMESHQDLSAAQSDFDLFVERGWQVEASEQARSWMGEAYESYQLAARMASGMSESEMADAISESGWGHFSNQSYDQAAEFFAKALEINRRLGREAEIARDLNHLGLVLKAQGRYEESISTLSEAVAINQHLGNEVDAARDLNNLGAVYYAVGAYDLAVSTHEQVLAIVRRLELHAETATVLGHLGRVYHAWGRYDEATDYYKEALEIVQRLQLQIETAIQLNNLGEVYRATGRFEEASDHFEQALAIFQGAGSEYETAVALINLGAIHNESGGYDAALSYFEQALEVLRRLGHESEIAIVLNHLGGVYHAQGHYDDAAQYYVQALEINQGLGRRAEFAWTSNNLGAVHFEQGRFEEAVDYFTQSIDVLEKLRQTATGSIRRDYLASQIGTYEYLILTLLRAGKLEAALDAIEQSQGRFLTEQLLETDAPFAPLSLAQIQQALGEDAAMLVFAPGAGTGNPIASLVITRDALLGGDNASITPLQEIVEDYHDQIASAAETQYRWREAQRQVAGLEKTGVLIETFDLIIQLYRSHLQDRTAVSRGIEAAGAESSPSAGRNLGRRFYDLLIAPVENDLEGKNKLIVVPYGALGFLPFETLIDADGRYLIERYDVQYVQSLTLWNHLRERTLPADRSPMLAFGAAVYDAATLDVEMVEAEAQFDAVEEFTYAELDRGGENLAESYARLGYGSWENLPGTLEEVSGLVERGADAITGVEVSERTVKQLSSEGRLDDYRVLHFATHGLVVPELPELSALVLSQTHDGSGEDGYLRMGEIAALDLAADFVNLSACETGLGKLYGGEGVVGLAQAFILAGANAVSVSLWQVADRSTSLFMQELYRQVDESDLSYADAMTEVKRAFIRGDHGEAYRAPYYWAPFVYYGR